MTPAVLFARSDSCYKTLPCDVYDAERDARTFPGGRPVVAHPPCRAWGSLSHFAKPRPDEKALATWAVDQIRICGGVLEHPAASRLWPEKGLPEPGARDEWGGWTLPVLQFWWGHRAEKATRLYICGIEPAQIPELPLVLGEPPCVIATSRRWLYGRRLRPVDPQYRPEVSKREREATPPAFAVWLVQLAQRCTPPVHLAA